MEDRKCIYCGKTFTPRYGNSQYCSDECRNKGALKYNVTERRKREKVADMAALPKRRKNRPSQISKKIGTAKKRGMTYADLQKEETLMMVEPINVEAYFARSINRSPHE